MLSATLGLLGQAGVTADRGFTGRSGGRWDAEDNASGRQLATAEQIASLCDAPGCSPERERLRMH